MTGPLGIVRGRLTGAILVLVPPRESQMTPSVPDDLAPRLRRLPLLALVGSIPAADLGAMAAAIEADRERIDAAGW